MAENEPNPNEPDPNAPPADDDDAVELASLAVDDGKGGKMVPLSALIGSKKTQRDLEKRVKELEPIAASATSIGARLNEAQPIINAVLNNPKLLAEAQRIAKGGATRATADTTEQPDDPDLVQYAEDNGFYLADGVTPDAARANRVLTLVARRNGNQINDAIRPLAGVTLGAKAEQNIRAAMHATDNDGVPWATRESIEEAVKLIPRHLLADEGVADLILNNAIGMDRRKGRTPKPIEEPLYMERQGGGGRQREQPLSEMERRHLASSGISEKDYRASSARLEQGAASRRGIELGKS